MEIEVHFRGRSCHASARNAVKCHYKMRPLVRKIQALNTRLRNDASFGKGTIAVTDIRSMSPSLCAVPGACSIHLDRPPVHGEIRRKACWRRSRPRPAHKARKVETRNYVVPSDTGRMYPFGKYYPSWALEETEIPW